MYAKRLDAGAERFTIACTCPTGQQTGSAVIPITITMNSDGPDYIDLTYSAVDVNGNPVSCAPAGNRLYVAKGSPANDNVTVTYSGGTVNFEATGQGEVYGYDVDGCSCNGISFAADKMKASKPAAAGAPKTAAKAAKGEKPTPNVKAAAYQPVTISADTPYWVSVVPIALQLTAAGPIDNVTTTYSAKDQNGTPLRCVPAGESFALQPPQPMMPLGTLVRHVAVRSTTATTSLTFTLTAQGSAPLKPGPTANTGTWTFSGITSASGAQAPAAPANGSGTGNLAAGYNQIYQLKEHIIKVVVTPNAGDLVTVGFFATDHGGQELRCRPRSVRAAATTPVYVNVNCDSDSPTVVAGQVASGIAAPIQFLAYPRSESSIPKDLAKVQYQIAAP